MKDAGSAPLSTKDMSKLESKIRSYDRKHATFLRCVEVCTIFSSIGTIALLLMGLQGKSIVSVATGVVVGYGAGRKIGSFTDSLMRARSVFRNGFYVLCVGITLSLSAFVLKALGGNALVALSLGVVEGIKVILSNHVRAIKNKRNNIRAIIDGRRLEEQWAYSECKLQSHWEEATDIDKGVI